MFTHFNPGHTLLPTFPSFRSMGMVGEACLPSNAYYPRTPDYTLYSGLHVCWSEHSDSSFVCGFMSLDYGLGTMTATTYSTRRFVLPCVTCCSCVFQSFLLALRLLRLGKRANLSAFRTFVRFALVWFYLFPLPLGVWEGLRLVIVALPWLFSYRFLTTDSHAPYI